MRDIIIGTFSWLTEVGMKHIPVMLRSSLLYCELVSVECCPSFSAGITLVGSIWLCVHALCAYKI